MAINSDKVLELAQKLISIPSDHEEKEVAVFLTQYLDNVGINATIQEAAPGRLNVVANITGNTPGPTVVFNGHLDVVPAGNGWSVPPYAGIVQGDKLYGRGSADMKGAIAAMICAAIEYNKNANLLPGSLILSFVADEEIGNKGMKHFLSLLPHADYAVVGEATNLGVAIGHRGVVRYQLKTYGRSVHASKPKEGINAIFMMSKVLQSLEKYATSLENINHPLLCSPSLSVGLINGGTKINIVPNECEIGIDRRLIPGESIDLVYKQLKETISNIQAREPNFKFTFEQTTCVPPGEIEASHILVQKAIETHKSFGDDVAVQPFSACCEASLLLEKGIPTIICGPGDINQAHVVDEHISISELVKASEYYTQLIMNLLKK